MHNEVVKSDIHSTDTHGYTDAVFGIMHLLKIEFYPRLRGLRNRSIYSFRKKKEYQELGFKILPDRYINEESIVSDWDYCLRFAATIKLKETTASQLFRRLSSYSKQHSLYKALQNYGRIQKSLFILKDIDDVTMRQRREKQLNKVENSNKFSKAIAFDNNNEFLQGTKEEQDKYEGCRRLIKNILIAWNYLYLENLVKTEKDEKRKQELTDVLAY